MIASSFMLLVGDDGALLVPPEGIGEPIYAGSSYDPILNALAQNPNKPVVVIADVLAQEIRCETVPPIGYFDKIKLLERRLRGAFPQSDLSGYITPCRNKVLLAGVHENNPATLWLDKLAELPNPSGKLCLLPLEGSDIATRLLPDDEWRLLISWQRTGGWRQIVTHKGIPVLTRRTPQLPEGARASEIAETILRDTQATLDYLPRMGLEDSGTQLSIAAILPEYAHPAVAELPLPVKKTIAITPYKAARKLELLFSPQPEDPAGDLLFAAYIGSRFSPRLTLMRPEARARRNAAIIKNCGMALAVAMWFLAIGSVVVSAHEVYKAWKNDHALTTEISKLKDSLTQEREKSGLSIEPSSKLHEALTRQRLFSSQTPTPWPLLGAIAQGLDQSARATNASWNSNGDILNLTLMLKPSAQITKTAMLENFRQIVENIGKSSPNYEIKIIRQPFSAGYSENISNKDGNVSEETNAPVTGEISIKRREK
ncbi:MAG: hypothetical protein PHX43_01950 [Alphaproteobacteria bacterium]|nr:hypothetical protein [Alphaproteobacteria bacterium]